MSAPITLRDEQGRGVFAFDPATDPYSVLHRVAWAHPNGVSVCDWSCPAQEGRYCVDCHETSWAALRAAKRRFVA